jgi:hypothetical protein
MTPHDRDLGRPPARARVLALLVPTAW